ncbi:MULTISPECIES: GMC family oxidoreductase N-terminal domain-containing protein [unclassified Novosphingobium]|uniref:GMC family oxidoreductase n=1 Tax=unclassified Novosphingobium TaxID=2644732 RepID=UPI0025F81417|nr:MULTISPECIES: GMC family oxidoreductase N-terminal domain-containing protein [unclassified Novosphingobium]
MNPDYIVIGAGSAGCVLANRLSGAGGGKVLLLEAGGTTRSILYRMPLAATKLWFNPKTSWGLWSEPEPGLDGRKIPVPRGKGLGGSSAINGTIYNRGSPHDYNQWRDLGLECWDYAALLPYFRRIENHWRGADAVHGDSGEVAVSPASNRSPFTPAFLETARQMGWAVTDDFLTNDGEGIGLSDLNVDRRGRRVSAADAFLRPISSRPSLTIEMFAQVQKIIIENGCATGVEYLHNGKRKRVRASREVIVAAGAIASPQILLLSGVGPADELAAIGIEPVIDLPGVGRNLNDQPGGSFEFTVKQPLSFVRNLRADRFALSLAQWALGLGGIAAGPPIVATGSVRTNVSDRSPDLRLNLAAATMLSKVWYPGISKPGPHKLMMSFGLAHPESRGCITLASADPAVPPRIRYNLLTAPNDMARMKAFYRLLTGMIRQPPFADIAGEITRPAAPLDDDAALERYLKSVAGTTSHPMGSCRMGIDAAAVVNAECKVHGIENLRVVDASIFPTQISGNPHAAIMAVGDKVSDMILGRAAL